MLDIDVTVKSIEIHDYSKEGLTLKIFFKDDKDKAMTHMVDLRNEEEAEAIIQKIRRYETEHNQNSTGDEDILAGVVNVRIHDEEETTKKMNQFLRKLSGNLKNVTSSRAALNYIQTLSNIKNLRLDLSH